MQTVISAAGRGTRLRPSTEDKAEGTVKGDGEPVPLRHFEQLVVGGVDELPVAVGCGKRAVTGCCGEEIRGLSVRHARQRDRPGLASALLTVQGHDEARRRPGIDGQRVDGPAECPER